MVEHPSTERLPTDTYPAGQLEPHTTIVLPVMIPHVAWVENPVVEQPRTERRPVT